MKILSPWPRPQGHPRGGDGSHKSFRPISTIMPNMNEIHQRVFKIWGLINFNTKTLTLWRKDERTNKGMYKRTNVRMNEQTNGKAKTIYPHILRTTYFPHYFIYIFLTSGVILHIHLLNVYCFPHSLNSDMSKYGYLEVFQWVPWNSR